MVDKLAGFTLIEFENRKGPRNHYFPMMIIRKNGGIVEATLSLNGFRKLEDSQKVIDATKDILGYLVEDDDGSDV